MSESSLAERIDAAELQELVKRRFTNKQLAEFYSEKQEINISIDQIKRLLKKLGVERFVKVSTEELVDFIARLRESEGDGYGRTYIVGAIEAQYGRVPQNLIQDALKILPCAARHYPHESIVNPTAVV
eukprot:GCRY01003935.1.p2 GENE.GCRY01003935.1~~GCRY01003935.1.p2  ORF type:complete len:128 (-),score=12.09 GCRY01003935.1:821-1204(-)